MQIRPTLEPMATDTFYDEDFLVWTEEQASALRRAATEGSNLPLDWDRLAEEIESLGSETVGKVESLLNALIVHLLLLAASPADGPRRKWMDEVDEFRDQIERVLKRNPSLRARLAHMIDEEWSSGFRSASRKLGRYGELETGGPILALYSQNPLRMEELLGEDSYPVRGSRLFDRAGR